MTETATPSTVRAAGALVAAEGAVGVLAAIVLVARAAFSPGEAVVSGFATSVWFFVLGGGVLAAGVALLMGRQWGRGLAVVSQLILVPVAWTLLTGSHQIVYGTILGIAVVGSLVLLFAPASTRWATQD